MKKTYIAPEMNVENILLETMIATSTMSITNDEVDAASNDKRGGWGNLWD